MLTATPILVPPGPTEPLLLYVAATTQVISVAVVVEWPEEGHALPVQRPIYFISEVLSETKGTIYPDSKISLCYDSRSTQATTLLSQPSNHGGLILSAVRDHPESRSHQEDRQMVGRANGGGPHICASQSHQVPSTGGLHHGMDRHLVLPDSGLGGTLDDVL